jgi:mRNA interferase HigB
MHVITRKRLNEFAERYPEASSALAHWYDLAKHQDFKSFVELRASFPSADQVAN